MVLVMKGRVFVREMEGKCRGHYDVRSHAVDENRETHLITTVEYNQMGNGDYGFLGGLISNAPVITENKQTQVYDLVNITEG